MAGEENDPEGGDAGNGTMTPEEIEALRKEAEEGRQAREELAAERRERLIRDAGIDTDNPNTDLFLASDRFKPDMTVEELREAASHHNILKPDDGGGDNPQGQVSIGDQSSTTTDPNIVGRATNIHDGPDGTPVPQEPDVKTRAKNTFDDALGKGASSEQARVAALAELAGDARDQAVLDQHARNTAAAERAAQLRRG